MGEHDDHMLDEPSRPNWKAYGCATLLIAAMLFSILAATLAIYVYLTHIPK